MWRYIFLAVSLGIFAIQGPSVMKSVMETRSSANATYARDSITPRATRSRNFSDEVIDEYDDRGPGFGRSERATKKSKPYRQASRPTKPRKANPLARRSTSAQMQPNGHFYFNTKMNGTPVKVMVDTGATGVAINRTTARRIGINLNNSDFKYKSQTANGVAMFASAVIDEIQIGRVVVRDVRAAVLKDSSLKDTLLGMTFLRKLRKFEISNNKLVLVQ